MSNDKAPFSPDQKVICLKNGNVSKIRKGDVVTVKDIIFKYCCSKGQGWFISLKEYSSNGNSTCADCYHTIFGKGQLFMAKFFAPFNPPYSKSTSKELAEKAMNVGDGADQPIKIKELIQN